MKKTIALSVFSFFMGLFLMSFLADYAVHIWWRGALERSNVLLLNSAYKLYKRKQYQDAAIVARQANLISQLPIKKWSPLYQLYNVALLRSTGYSDAIYPNKNEFLLLVAYLYNIAGKKEISERYYTILTKNNGVTKTEINSAAKDLLDYLGQHDDASRHERKSDFSSLN